MIGDEGNYCVLHIRPSDENLLRKTVVLRRKMSRIEVLEVKYACLLLQRGFGFPAGLRSSRWFQP